MSFIDIKYESTRWWWPDMTTICLYISKRVALLFNFLIGEVHNLAMLTSLTSMRWKSFECQGCVLLTMAVQNLFCSNLSKFKINKLSVRLPDLYFLFFNVLIGIADSLFFWECTHALIYLHPLTTVIQESVSYDDVMQMHYLDQCMYESLRIFPPFKRCVYYISQYI